MWMMPQTVAASTRVKCRSLVLARRPVKHAWPWLLAMALSSVGGAIGAHAIGADHAYIGPGAGIALLGSFLTVFFATLSAFAVISLWGPRSRASPVGV